MLGEIKMEETTDKQTWAIYNAGDSSWDTNGYNYHQFDMSFLENYDKSLG